MLNVLRYDLGMPRSGILPKVLEDRMAADKQMPDTLPAARAIACSWRIAQCHFAGRQPTPADLAELDYLCAIREHKRTHRHERDAQLAQQLQQAARRGYPALAVLADELPRRCACVQVLMGVRPDKLCMAYR